MDMNTPLREARQWLRERIDKGVHCPLCGQTAKIYRRTINANMAVFLIRAYNTYGEEEFHATTFVNANRGVSWADYSKLRYWGLLAPIESDAEDGNSAGYWRVTAMGKRYALGGLNVPRYVLVYNNKPLGLEGPEGDIQSALGDKFNLRDLLDR